MISKKDFMKIFLLVPLVWLHRLGDLLAGKNNNSVGFCLSTSILGLTDINGKRIFILVVEGLMYIMVFHILYGNFISEHFRHSSVYVFSRIKDRKKWFAVISSKLAFLCVSYVFLFLMNELIISKISSTQNIDWEAIQIFLLMWIMLVLILLSTTIIINIISLKYGNSIGFLVVYISLLILTFIAVKSPRFAFVQAHPFLIMLNPAAALSFNFTQDCFMQMGIIIYYVLINIFVVAISAVYVDRYDIALYDAESR